VPATLRSGLSTRRIAQHNNPEASIPRTELKKNWAPDERTFHRLLQWLDDGVDSAGERYLEMRRRLELYFERRNCLAACELADETLNRVARRLDEEGTIKAASPAHFCYIVAKLVLLESLRRRSAVIELPDDIPAAEARADANEQLLDDLEACLQALPDADRTLILEYYRGEQRERIERRQAMAARLGLTMNALSIRACRLRDKLEACMRSRLRRV